MTWCVKDEDKFTRRGRTELGRSGPCLEQRRGNKTAQNVQKAEAQNNMRGRL